MTQIESHVFSELQKAGYGWKKYADSVLSQGRITEKQWQTAKKMLSRLRSLQADAQYRRSNYRKCEYDETDISDCEAISFNKYF